MNNREDNIKELEDTFEVSKKLAAYFACEKMGVVPEGFVRKNLPADVMAAINRQADKDIEGMDRTTQIVWTIVSTLFKEMEIYKYVDYDENFIDDFIADWHDLYMDKGLSLLEKFNNMQ